MKSPYLAGASLVLIALAACRAIPAPSNGVLALSAVLLPSPSVVLGDTLRDSTGHAARLTLVAFGLGGDKDTIRSVTPSYVILDRGAHVTGDGYVIGDSVRATPVRIVGTVGTLQTAATNLDVTPRPDSLASAVTPPIAPIKFNILDSTAQANYSVGIAATVVSTSILPAATVKSVIVRYALAGQPRGVNGAATGVLVDESGKASLVDTTDASGQVSRRIRVRPAALAAPGATDSFVVVVSAQYRGVALRGSPQRFVIPVQPGSATPTRIP